VPITIADVPLAIITMPLCNLANKLLGRLWWCLQNNQLWDDATAWNLPADTPLPVAA
jgi:hypothetical protein